jgi:hypothetical protein
MEDLYEQFASSAPQLDEEEPEDGISEMMASGMDLHDSGTGGEQMTGDLGAWGDEEQTLSPVRFHSPARGGGGGGRGAMRTGLVSPPRSRGGAEPEQYGSYSRQMAGLVSPPRGRPGAAPSMNHPEREYLDHTGRVPTARAVTKSSLNRLASPQRRGRKSTELVSPSLQLVSSQYTRNPLRLVSSRSLLTGCW